MKVIARPFFPWPGNKVKLVPFIAPMIPPHVETFLEVFGGSAALSLALKPKKGRLDIYNDVDNDLFNVLLQTYRGRKTGPSGPRLLHSGTGGRVAESAERSCKAV